MADNPVIIGGATLYLGDCLEVMPTLGKVDAVVTDPPYFVPSQSYVGTRKDGYSKKLIGDISILNGYFDSLFVLIDSLINDGGTYYVFCDAKSYPVFWRSLYPHCEYVRLLIWNKVVSYNGYTWRHQHELIAWGEKKGASRIPTGDGDVLTERGVLQKDRSHPAEKPVPLIQKLIEKHEDQIIFDPFMGSGTTGVACVNLGRKFIGIEIEPKYFDIACKRIDQAQRQGQLFQPEAKSTIQETMFDGQT